MKLHAKTFSATSMLVLLTISPLWAANERPEATLGRTNDGVNHLIRLAIGGFAAPNDEAIVHERSEALVELVMTELSSDRGFELVERQEMDKILKEAVLGLNGSSNAKEAINIGKLLRADWLLLGSLVRKSATNAAVIKIVDAESGIIRDLTVVSLDPELLRSAKTIAEFVHNSARTVSRTKPRIFLGVGQFENLGITTHFGDFGNNLRVALEQAYQGSRVSIVERGSVNPLQNELRLHLGGLTLSAPESGPAQPAFLLIDGMYRLVQDDQFKISLLLRLQNVGAKSTRYFFTEAPGKALDAKIIAAINASLDGKATNSYSLASHDEARLQFIRGKDLSGLYHFTDGYAWLGGYTMESAPGKRLNNIREAITAFETATFLDPDYDDAKIYLAVCLASPDINNLELARDYFYEVFAGSTNAALVEFAHTNLVRYYFGQHDESALASLSVQASANATLQAKKAKAERVGKPIASLPPSERAAAERDLEIRHKRILADCQQDQTAIRAGSPVFTYARLLKHFDAICAIMNRNTNDTRSYIAALVPRLVEQYPPLEMYLLGSYLVWAPDGSASHWGRLEQQLDDMGKQPVKSPAQRAAHRAFLEGLTESCLSAKRYGVARKAVKLLKSLADGAIDAAAIDRWNIYLAYCDREEGHWQEAREAFERMGKLETPLRVPGPWGRAPFYFKAEQAADECRKQLHIASPPVAPAPKPARQAPRQFALNKAVLTLGKSFLLASDGDQMWLADGIVPFVWDKSREILTEIELPDGVERNITCIAQRKNTVWFGTEGSGLIELDKATKKAKLIQEGLLVPNILCLLPTEDRLWLGYGKNQDGGLGYLDRQKSKIYGMTPELDSKSVLPFAFSMTKQSVQTPFEVAPAQRVIGIAQISREEIWLASQGLGIRRYSFVSNVWNLRGDEWNSVNGGRVSLGSLRVFALTPEFVIYGGDGYGGGLGIYDRKRRQIQLAAVQEWLPEWVFNGYRFKGFLSAAVDGDHIWAGGEGFLAHINLATARVEKLCDLRDGHIRVHGLEVDGNNLWVAAEGKLYRLAKANL